MCSKLENQSNRVILPAKRFELDMQLIYLFITVDSITAFRTISKKIAEI